MQQSWEFTFMKVFTHTKTKWASKKIFINRPAKQHGRYGPFSLYLLHCSAGYSETGCWNFFWCLFGLCMDEIFQKSELPTLLQFVKVRTAHQPHVISWLHEGRSFKKKERKKNTFILRKAKKIFYGFKFCNNNSYVKIYLSIIRTFERNFGCFHWGSYMAF